MLKSEENMDSESTVYIGIDPEILLKSFDIEKLFGFGSYTVQKIGLEEESLSPKKSIDNIIKGDTGETECKLCEYKSHSKIHFKRHMARVHEKHIQCDQCSFSCGSSDYLRDHMKASHEGTKLKCKECPSEFNWRSDLSRHIKGVHSGIVYACFVCSLELSSDKSLKRHMSKSKCRLNLPPDFSWADLEKYIKSGLPGATKKGGEGLHKNETAALKLLDTRELKIPEKTEESNKVIDMKMSTENTEKKLFKCLSCEKTFNKLYNMKVHINCIHNMANMEKCLQCDYECSVKESMKQHILSAHKGEKYHCAECDKLFSWKSDLRRHIKNLHSTETYTCTECLKVFSQERNMKEHVRNKCCSKSKDVKNRKVVEEDLICSYCGYATADRRTLERHINGVHLKQGMTKCKECDYSSIRSDDVKRHFEHKHLGKQYVCDICSKICKWKPEFDQHMRMHDGAEFLCDICDFRTSYRSGLSRHKKSIHEGIKFECEHCNQCYTQMSSLRTHQKLKHSQLMI